MVLDSLLYEPPIKEKELINETKFFMQREDKPVYSDVSLNVPVKTCQTPRLKEAGRNKCVRRELTNEDKNRVEFLEFLDSLESYYEIDPSEPPEIPKHLVGIGKESYYKVKERWDEIAAAYKPKRKRRTKLEMEACREEIEAELELKRQRKENRIKRKEQKIKEQRLKNMLHLQNVSAFMYPLNIPS